MSAAVSAHIAAYRLIGRAFLRLYMCSPDGAKRNPGRAKSRIPARSAFIRATNAGTPSRSFPARAH